MSASEWVESAFKRELTEFQKRAVNLLCRAWGCGPYDIGTTFQKADWNFGKGVRFTVMAFGGLSTYDASQLTTLVIGAHEEAIRVEIEPCNPRHLRVVMHPRMRASDHMHARHPSLEDAVSIYRYGKKGATP